MTALSLRFLTPTLLALLSFFPVCPLAHATPSVAEHAPADSTRRGIVWAPPASSDAALDALQRIAQTGADAVRLLHPPADTILSRADTLGLALFVDLPVAHVPASALADSLRAAEQTLNRLHRQTNRHESLQAVGLAHHTDTTIPAACDILAEWSEQVHAASTLDTYYVTPFAPSADRCANATDRVLIDLRGRRAPLAQWRDWEAAHPGTGIGALGMWTRPDAAPGLRVPHSPEQQARYLERTLTHQSTPSIVFVDRWQDAASPLLPSRRYGLHAATGQPRPAARVVRGLYSGTQQVFAFPNGNAPANTPYGLLLLSWMLVAVLGGLYAGRPFVRLTLSRYFRAHGFYRDAIREGRDLEVGATSVFLSIVTVALGIMGVCATRSAADAPLTETVLAAVPEGLRGLLAFGVEQPEAAGLLFGGAVLWFLLLWTTALVVTARRAGSFSLSQGLMLITWPCWLVVPALPLALIATIEPPVPLPVLSAVLLLASGGAVAYFTVRVLLDYQAVTGLSWGLVAPLAALSPPVLGLGIAGALVLLYDVPLRFLWHLAVLT